MNIVYNYFMNNYMPLEIVKKEFLNKIKTLSKEELDIALGFGTKKDKILSLFSIRYKDVIKLVNEGILIYALIYKTEFYLNGNSNFFKSWILFSPTLKFEENPDEYLKFAAKLNYFLENTPKKYKKLAKKITNKDNDFSFFELPKEYFEERILLSTSYSKETITPDLVPGITCCLMNRKLSKKIIILPFYKDIK